MGGKTERPSLTIVQAEEAFPGSGLFTKVQAFQIEKILEGIHLLTVVGANEEVNEHGVSITTIERSMVNAQVAANRIAQALGESLSFEEMYRVIYDAEKQGFTYPREMPLRIHQILSNRHNDPDDAA